MIGNLCMVGMVGMVGNVANAGSAGNAGNVGNAANIGLLAWHGMACIFLNIFSEELF